MRKFFAQGEGTQLPTQTELDAAKILTAQYKRDSEGLAKQLRAAQVRVMCSVYLPCRLKWYDSPLDFAYCFARIPAGQGGGGSDEAQWL